MKYFDITKSIALLAIVAFLWFHGGKYIGNLNNSFVQPSILKTVGVDALKLSMIEANNAEVKKLRDGFAKEKSRILKAYEEDKKHTKEVLEELGEIKAKQKQTVNLINRGSDKITDPKNKLLKYEFKKIYAKDTNGVSFPVSWVQYFPNQTDDKRWKTGTYPLEYHTKVIETENTDGTFNRYAEMHLENNQMKETKGQQYPIKLENIEWAKVELEEHSWMLWNPRIGFGALSTSKCITPTLDISISSYGKTRRDMDWRFFTLGLGVTKADDSGALLVGSFEPFSWNIGNVLPLVENIFIGPVGTIDSDSTVGLGIKAAIPF